MVKKTSFFSVHKLLSFEKIIHYGKGNFRILSWNINGIRAVWKKGFPEWLEKESPDILCLQETKAQVDQLGDEIKSFKDYKSFFFSAEKKGYSGVAVYSKIEPIAVRSGFGIPEFDGEGRVLEVEYENFVLFNVYFPNGGRGPERVQYKLEFQLRNVSVNSSLQKSVCRLHREPDIALYYHSPGIGLLKYHEQD